MGGRTTARSARRVAAEDPGKKPARRRLTVLEAAERPGDVGEACRRGGIEALLALEGRRPSTITVLKILDDEGVGTLLEHGLALERQAAGAAIEPSAEQAAFQERPDPCSRERQVESGRLRYR
jgi:hypothetical protein